MSSVSIHKPVFFRFYHHNGFRNSHHVHSITPSCSMAMDSKSSNTRQSTTQQIPRTETSRKSDLELDKLQPLNEELIEQQKAEFGEFVAREALLDEEFWTAAWLRAETHWEGHPNDRYADSYKRKFAEQEFNAIKRVCNGQTGQKCKCIVTVKTEESNVKGSVLKSVVGCLDLSIRHLLHGETFPGERVKAPLFCSKNREEPNRYSYIANLCVSKAARRQGIASNMLYFAVQLAKSNGVEDIYVHVHRSNKAAQELYKKMGFEIVDMASSKLLEDKTYLLHLKM